MFTTGGIDGVGNAYSEKLLGASRLFYEELFDLGPANELDAISCASQIVSLPLGKFTSLTLLGAAVEGDQSAQTLTVFYKDGTTSVFTQNFSDWFTPQSYSSENEAVAMQYRDQSNGTKDDRPFNLYSYHFALNSAKFVESVTLPNNGNVVVLAATLH